MLKYKMITSVALALLVAGCGVNDNNDNGRENVGLNTTNRDNGYSGVNVNDVNNRMNNGTDTNNVRNVGYTNFNDNDFTLSDDVANRVAGLKEVKSATVILTDHRAYVAAVLHDNQGKNISTKVENKIADTVRKADKSVDKVYVSTNPDFVDRVNQYANDVGNGRPVTGFGQEFGQIVNRIFPNAR